MTTMTMTDRHTAGRANAIAVGSAVIAVGAASAAKRAADCCTAVDGRARAAEEAAAIVALTDAPVGGSGPLSLDGGESTPRSRACRGAAGAIKNHFGGGSGLPPLSFGAGFRVPDAVQRRWRHAPRKGMSS